MVYSTCSLNPVEDEAVIAALLEKSEGACVCWSWRDSEHAVADGGGSWLFACTVNLLPVPLK